MVEQQSSPMPRNEQARAQVFLLLLESGVISSTLVESIIVPAMMDFPHDIKCSVAALTLLVRFLIPPPSSSSSSPSSSSSKSSLIVSPSSPTKQLRLSQLGLFQSPAPAPAQDQYGTMTRNNNYDRKALFVSSGALQQTIHLLERRGTTTPDDVSSLKVISLAVQLLAELSLDASDALKNDHLLPRLAVVHHVMKATAHVAKVMQAEAAAEAAATTATTTTTTTTTTEPTSSSSSSTKKNIAAMTKSLLLVHQSACHLLRNLSNPLLQELVAAGSWSVLIESLQTFPHGAILQEHANVALYNLLTVCPTELLRTRSSSGSTGSGINIIPSVLQGMTLHPTALQVQTYGLLVLTRLSNKEKENYEVVVAKGGLTVILSLLSSPIDAAATTATTTATKTATTNTWNHVPTSPRTKNSTASKSTSKSSLTDDEYQEQQDTLVQLACQYLRNLSRHSLDLQRAIVAKGGIGTVLHVMQQYATCINVQDPCLASLRNLVTSSDNRKTLVVDTDVDDDDDENEHENDNENDDDTTTTSLRLLLSTIVQTMNRYPSDAALQAYGCDALGRLVLEPEHLRQVLMFNGEPGIATIALRAMRDHRTHAGVQDRAVFLVLGLLGSTNGDNGNDHGNDENSNDQDKDKALRRTIFTQLQDQQQRPLLIDFIKETLVPQHKQDAMERLQRLIDIVEQLQPPPASSSQEHKSPPPPQQQQQDGPSPKSVLDMDQTFSHKTDSSGPPTTEATPATFPTAKFYLSKGWQLVGQGRAVLLGKSSPVG